jgi:hypothetical protein
MPQARLKVSSRQVPAIAVSPANCQRTCHRGHSTRTRYAAGGWCRLCDMPNAVMSGVITLRFAWSSHLARYPPICMNYPMSSSSVFAHITGRLATRSARSLVGGSPVFRRRRQGVSGKARPLCRGKDTGWRSLIRMLGSLRPRVYTVPRVLGMQHAVDVGFSPYRHKGRARALSVEGIGDRLVA